MKILAIATITVLALARGAFATEVVELPASQGKVTFPHKKHQDMLRDCTKCHEKGPGKIQDLGKEWAHRTCRGCHSEMKKGPTGCKECHKK